MRYLLALGIVCTLASCSGGGGSEGKLNPFNWFKNDRAQNQNEIRTLAPGRGYGFATETRPMVDQVTALSIEKTATGAIIRATALTPTQGYHSADLVLMPSTKAGEVSFQFRARPPAQPFRTGPTHLREIVVGFAISQAQLRGIRRINIIAARNSRSIRP